MLPKMQPSATRQKFALLEPVDLCNKANSSISTMVSTVLSAIRYEMNEVAPEGEQTRPEDTRT